MVWFSYDDTMIVTGLAMSLCFGGKKTSITINKIKILLIYIYIYIKQNDSQYRYIAKTTNTKQSQQTQEYPQVWDNQET